MAGKVWLVGAGPSDPGLLTVKGKAVLEQAQAVVYDRLVGDGILALIPEAAEKIDVGKRAGSHTMPQEEINRLLLALAQEGKQVVRLKGGDPFLFGRGGEELELLVENHIPFEIIPGITSAVSVPAYNGIPVTHRDYTSSLHIITGHKREGQRLELDFEALVRLEGTLVFLMGVSALGDICSGLLAAGMEPDMPAAVLQQGTTAGQKKIIAALSTLEEAVEQQGIETPAIIVVGKVCSLGREFGWYEKKPLFGMKILVTRPQERSGTISQKLRDAGAEVLELPAIAALPLQKHPEWNRITGHLEAYDYLAFTSPAGVRIFFDRLKQQKQDIRSLGTARLAAVGAGTAKELADRGLVCELVPEIYDGEHLGILLGETAKPGEHILIPRAKEGNQKLIEEIRKRTAAEVTDLPVYETVYREPVSQIPLRQELEQGKIHLAVFTSASTVKGFAAALPGLDVSQVHAVCIGRQTQAEAQRLGMKTSRADRAELDSLVSCCMEVAEQRRGCQTKRRNQP